MDAIIALSADQVRDNPFVDAEGRASFYRMAVDVACAPFRKNYDDVESLDCTRILVSADIQDSWVESMQEMGHSQESIMMTLANWGPKADKSLPERTVVFQEGAIAFEGGTKFPTEQCTRAC